MSSLFQFTDRERLHLWAGVDGHYDPRVLEIARQAGFELVSLPTRHLGIARAWTALIEAVAKRAAPDDVILNLEEDWQLCRPLPMGLAVTLLRRHGVEAVRIWKRRFSTAGATEMYAHGGADVQRVWVGPSWVAHPPAIGSVRFFQWLNTNIADESQMIARCIRAKIKVAWFQPQDACFCHIGTVRSRRLGGKT